MGYAISNDRMEEILRSLEKDYRIFAPKRGPKYIRYGEITSVSQIVYQEKSHFSPKEVFYPIVQTLLYFRENECHESELKDERDIILFVRPCDINGIHRLDTMFLENGGREDNFYQRMRRKVKFFLMECRESFDTCFCVSMGSNTTEDYSVAVRFEPEGFKVQVKDEAFAKVFAQETVCDFMPEYVTENKKKVRVPDIPDRSMVGEIHKLPFWRSFDEKCISCGGCNTVCITCSCFDTADVIYNETSRDGERRRIWSSCMLKDFTTMAGGHGVRDNAGDRMRFKTMHKVYDFKSRFGRENMCVGCGRCDMHCPADIHFSETVSRLAEEVELLKIERGRTSQAGEGNADE